MSEPTRLAVGHADFGATRFWAALRRVAAQDGHADHATYLAGTTSRSNEYTYTCAKCQQPIVVVRVNRSATPPNGPVS